MTLTRSTHTCGSCTARQQQMRRMQKKVRGLEAELAALKGQLVPIDKPEEGTLCVACGHYHPKSTSRHHRVPRRISWKIPAVARKEILGDAPEIINLCRPCHAFIESASSTSRARVPHGPCGQPIGPLATVTWGRLMEEIRLFEKVAENITADLVAELAEPIAEKPTDKSAEKSAGKPTDGPTYFAERLREAIEK